MKNKLTDLYNHLMLQAELLGDPDIKGEKLVEQMNRARTMNAVAGQIVNVGRLMVDAVRAADRLPGMKNVPLLPKGSYGDEEDDEAPKTTKGRAALIHRP